jgi:hypothetical protein
MPEADMRATIPEHLKKLKSILFDQYLLYILVPMGFIYEFLVTLPFLILCTLDIFLQKRD